jgi:hypothetical protein
MSNDYSRVASDRVVKKVEKRSTWRSLIQSYILPEFGETGLVFAVNKQKKRVITVDYSLQPT